MERLAESGVQAALEFQLVLPFFWLLALHWLCGGSNADSMSDLWDVLTGKAQRESDIADAKLAKLNRDKFDNGEWTKDQFDTAEQHRAQGAIQDAAGSVITEAKLGAAEGLSNVAGAISDSIDNVASTATGFVWKSIPWWGWLLLAAGGLLWLYVNFAPARAILKRVIPK